MMTTAEQLFSIYDEEIVNAAKQIFSTYGGKAMRTDDRLIAMIEYARHHPELSGEQMADVLHVLDEVVTNPVIDDFSEAA